MKHTLKIFLVLGAMMAVCLVFNAEAKADTTWVSGTISINTNWTPAGNPYMVIGGTRVDTNVVLTIQPGVIVKFNPNLGLTIDGALNARGTPSDSIIFTAIGGGDWTYILFSSASIDTVCFLEYCRIEWSAYSIIFQGASPVVSHCNISNNGGTGYDASGPALRIETGSAPKILYNTISSNLQNWAGTGERYGGIDIQPGSSPVIIGNLIQSNSVSSSCTFGECGCGWGGGIAVRSDSDKIVGNMISGNSANGGFNRTCGGGGIAILNCSPLVVCNTINGNFGRHGGGIWLSGGNPIISCNTLTGNRTLTGGINAGGIFTSSGEGVFVLNNITDNHEFINSVFEVYAGGGSSVLNMDNNWWGTTDTNMINLLLYDFRDDPNLRKIDYSPFSTSVNTVSPDSIVVITPNGGEHWQVGSQQRIIWNPFCFNDDVKIEYSTNSGSSWVTVAGSVRNIGSYLWTIPLTPSPNCRVKISDRVDSVPSDISDHDFIICASYDVSVIYPNGGETLCPGDSVDIIWSLSCIDSVRIYYSTNGGASWSLVVGSTPSDGSYRWEIPDILSDHYRIKICKTDETVCDISDGNFTVSSEEVITVVTPNGGEKLCTDSIYNIIWNSSCFWGDVKIDYSTNGGSSWIPITASTLNTGIYSWTIPNTSSDSCFVKVSDAQDGDPSDMSNGYFTIISIPTIVLKSPNGGEKWRIGSTHDILWDHFCFPDSVIIEYTIVNGTIWDTIVDRTTNDGVYGWTIPDTLSDSCLVRISDVVDNIPSDESDSVFSIVAWIRGDANGSGLIELGDVVYLITYLYKNGPSPDPLLSGDANCSGEVELGDVVYLITYLYKGGPPPPC